MRTLLIDNHDSFTYNLFHLLAEVNGEPPLVVRNDEAAWEEIAGREFDNIVLSPGPGRPEQAGDFGICAAAIRAATVPLLGVCLGHQGLGWMYGGRVVHAPQPAHGRIATIHHSGTAPFAGIPRTFRAVRYHSLCLSEPLPEELEPIAWADDGVLMALAHRRRPQWGVQFHPESICSEHGRRLLANFRDLTPQRNPIRGSFGTRGVRKGPQVGDGGRSEVKVRRIDGDRDPEAAFEALYGERGDAFWLDSSRLGEGARFSFIGAPGPLGATISYDLEAGEVRVERGGEAEVRRESIFDYLEGELRRMRQPADDLPFDFNCGFVGCFGYELKAECGGEAAHRAAGPDAAFLFADRVVAFDHDDARTYLLCLVEDGGHEAAERWLAETEERLAALPAGSGEAANDLGDGEPIEFGIVRDRGRYLEDVAVCKQRLRDGESYEICLTNRVVAARAPAPLPLYRALRRVNPAPYAAFFRFGETAVLSSSPERFLRIDPGGGVEAKPIKGTAPRGGTPEEDARLAEALHGDEKNRAENLMIVDLLRNDLGRVCEVGSITVPGLIEVESFETVHQLVSTVRGSLREDVGPVGCVRACFPPGSMTGAPKERTMAILDELEGEARGIYSGAIGYLGLSGGCNLSVAIRTIVIDPEGRAGIGAGGAIVNQSDPELEYDEMLLKAWAPMRAIDPTLPSRYSRIKLSASISRVTPRKSITCADTSTTRE
jgi:para-aminobenzoate synthetase